MALVWSVRVAELEQRGGHGAVDDLDHAAADQLLVLHQAQLGLDAGGVAVHHEADGAGGSQHGDLGVAVAVFFALGQRRVPDLCGGLLQLRHLAQGTSPRRC